MTGPSVCHCDCGLTIDGEGRLCLEWDAVCAREGSVADGSFSSVVNGQTDGWLISGAVRTEVCNNTCRDRIVTYRVEIPHVSMNQDGSPNYWDVAIYGAHQLDTPPSIDSFAVAFAGRVRHANNTAGVARLSATLQTPTRRIRVPAGRCAHLAGTVWRDIHERSGSNNVNLLSWPRMELVWHSWPVCP